MATFTTQEQADIAAFLEKRGPVKVRAARSRQLVTRSYKSAPCKVRSNSRTTLKQTQAAPPRAQAEAPSLDPGKVDIQGTMGKDPKIDWKGLPTKWNAEAAQGTPRWTPPAATGWET